MPDTPTARPRHKLPDDNRFSPNPRAPFVELGLASCFSFLHGASEADELLQRGWEIGYDTLGIADLNSFAGVVRFHTAALKTAIRPVIGTRLHLVTGEEFLAYPKDRDAYGRLSRLITSGRRHRLDGSWQDKGACDITLDALAAHTQGSILILIPPRNPSDLAHALPRLRTRLPDLQYIAASWHYHGDDRARINRLDQLAQKHGLSLLATNDVLYHAPDRRPLQDVMTCIRTKTRLTDAGPLLSANAERHLKSPQEMQRLFAEWPHAIRATRIVADQCRFDLRELSYEYPREVVPQGMTPQTRLEELTWLGAENRYPDGVPPKTRDTLRKELAMIEKLDIAQYFLTIHDIIRFAREDCSPPILCQGRGSAANSAVCYVLGITSVDPAKHQLLFERFISEERKEPPDIDVDFEHERREEVIQHIYNKYGRDRAGLCATVIHYRPRSAIREVGKVMGLSEDVTSALAKTVWGSWGSDIENTHAHEAGVNLEDPHLRRVLHVARQLIGMPRHLGQHVGGFILTQRPLSETVPIGNGAMEDRSFIEWDKDDIDALGILKVDILALGMLTCIRKCFDLIDAHFGRHYTLATVPQEDPRVYDMLCRGDSIGVFQVESRAQINMLPRLRPREFYDLVIEVAIVRPGPIQGDMVHPYLRRRNGEEAVAYPSPAPPNNPAELKDILDRTLGVPIFQEQAMKIAIDAAQFSPAEANELRKAMATFRSKGTIGRLEEKMVTRMVARGYEEEFAKRCFNQIKGFGEYGFPESHAASFAHLVYVSSWLKCHYPAAFTCALLNSQPMGFYAPAQLVRDARDHGVEVRPVDVNFSQWDNTLEPVITRTQDRGGSKTHSTTQTGFAIRLGFRQITRFQQQNAEILIAARTVPFEDVAALQARSGLTSAPIRKLAEADAMRSMFIDRRQALWEARALKDTPDLPLFNDQKDEGEDLPVALPEMPVCEQVLNDYQTLRLSLKAHPMTFFRSSLHDQGIIPCRSLRNTRNGQRIKLSGVVLIRQRPGSAKGVCFITIEDETGVANLVVWPKIMETYRKQVMQSRLLLVHGRVQRDVEIIHVIVDHLEDKSDRLWALSGEAPANPERTNAPSQNHPRNQRIIPHSRDFH
jgi:error-prone DNA polymerase